MKRNAKHIPIANRALPGYLQALPRHLRALHKNLQALPRHLQVFAWASASLAQASVGLWFRPDWPDCPVGNTEWGSVGVFGYP